MTEQSTKDKSPVVFAAQKLRRFASCSPNCSSNPNAKPKTSSFSHQSSPVCACRKLVGFADKSTSVAPTQTQTRNASGTEIGTRYRYIDDTPLVPFNEKGTGSLVVGSGSSTSAASATAKTRSRPSNEYVLYSYGEPIAMTADGNTSYFGTDILGSVRNVTDKYGAVQANYNYDAFGAPYLSNLDHDIGFGYCGKTYDNGTGLYDYGFRDYSPNQARFTTVDPIRDGANWFAYVVNDPVNYIDPNGLYVINNTDQWILIKPENSDGFISLAPHSKYDGKNVPGFEYDSKKEIDSGKIDGIILSDGTIFKVSDSENKNLTPWDISLILTQNGDNISCSYANAISETLDTIANKQKSSNEDPSNINGDYHLGDPNIECGGWLPKFENNDVLQNVLRDNTTEKSRFFTSKTLLNLIEAYSKSNKMTVINMGLKNNMASSSIMSNYPPFDQRFLPLQIPTPQVLGLLEANSLPKNHEQFNLNRCSMNFSVNNAGNDIIKDILEPATGEGCSK